MCAIAGAIGLSYLKLKTVVFWGDYILKIFLGLLIMLFLLAINTSVNIGNRVSTFLGAISYEVYLLHGMVFGLIDTMLPRLESGEFIVLSIVITVVLSTVTERVCDFIYRI